jgi:hypothetical protein
LITLAGLPVTFFRLNPQVTNLNIVGNNSHSTFDGLKITVVRRLSAGLSLQANYTLAKGFTNYVPGTGNPIGSLYQDFRDNANHKLDKALSPSNATHTVIASWIYELPFGSGKRFLSQTSGLIKGFLGGWQINGIYNFATGRPLAITTGRYNLSANVASTPNFSGSQFDLSKPFYNGTQITTLTPAQAAQFSNPGPGEAGNLPKYSFRGPGISNLDMSMFKSFKTELAKREIQAQFRLEFFNVFNTVNYSNPNVNLNGGSFGVITSTFPARIGQIALKILF